MGPFKSLVLANSKDLARRSKHDFVMPETPGRSQTTSSFRKKALINWTFERVRSKDKFLLILKTQQDFKNMILLFLETTDGSQTRSSFRKNELIKWSFELVRSKVQFLRKIPKT